MKKIDIEAQEWVQTPVKDKEFDESRMEILGMKLEEYAEFCCKLSAEDILILSGNNKSKIKQLKRKYKK